MRPDAKGSSYRTGHVDVTVRHRSVIAPAMSLMWVNNNGNVTFDEPLATFTPQPLNTFGTAIVAAWFADVDTPGPESRPVRYGQGSVGGRPAFCVDDDRVGFSTRTTIR